MMTRDIELFPALLAIYEEILRSPVDFPHKVQVIWNFFVSLKDVEQIVDLLAI